FIHKASGTLDLLTQAKLVAKFTPVSHNIHSLYSGYYIAELLTLLTEDFDPAPEVFDLAVRSLEQLSDPQTAPLAVAVRFELNILKLVGMLPNLAECCVCGEPVESGQKFVLWVSQGGLLCSACRREEYTGRSVSAGALAVLRKLVSSDSALSGRIHPSEKQLSECHLLAVSVITAAIGRKPATLRYINLPQ
ncbi:MAG: DNA repair protein RecO, partial [Planctomycetaceae bacterium]|nr:DNA repair protein RecO [Planctomycetaceae bacterium]